MIEITLYNEKRKLVCRMCFSGDSTVDALLRIWNRGGTLNDITRVERIQEPTW